MVLNFVFLLTSIFFPKPDTLIFENSFGNFQNAVSISTAREEFIFVCDTRANQVIKFSAKGEQLTSIGGAGFGQNELNRPEGIDASSGLDVYVCDYQNNRIQKYDLNLSYITTFDFNNYNVTALNSDKIFFPASIAFLSTSEIFVLADASQYRMVKLKSFDEVNLLFCSGNLGVDKLYNPTKIARGSNLDIYILDKYTNDVINFDNYGTYVRRLDNPDSAKIVSISYYGDELYILKDKYLVTYDLKAQRYSNLYFINPFEKVTFVDITVLKKSKILILTTNKVMSFNINQ